MNLNPLVEVPEPTAAVAERHGDEDSSDEDLADQILEFSSLSQDDNSRQLNGENDRVVGDLPLTCTERGENEPKLKWKFLEEENEAFVKSIIEMHNAAPHDDNDQEEDVEEAVDQAPPAPPEMRVNLFNHQKQWLVWAIRQEESPFRGGILADEVGMGKTTQAIALVLAKLEISRRSNTAGTLVVCSPAALTQWETDIRRCTQPGSVKVLVYHGRPRRKGMVLDFYGYDFVLTTYSIAGIERRHHLLLPKILCDFCGQELYRENMKFHGRFFCQRSYEDSTGGDIRAGSSRKQESERKLDFLYSVRWERIILDESQAIKNKDTSTTKGILALESTYKWALTGTSLVELDRNVREEIYSLIRFLRVYPYAYFFCESCNFKSLDSELHSTSCPIHLKDGFYWWHKYIRQPQRYTIPERERANTLLIQKILKSIMLRRTKESVRADIGLPLKIVTIRRDTLDVRGKHYYQTLYEESRLKVIWNIEAAHNTMGYDRIMKLITTLQKTLDHPYLVEFSKPGEERLCAICQWLAADPAVTTCGHTFCNGCLEDFTNSLGKSLCPTCSLPFTLNIQPRENNAGGPSANANFRTSGILERISLEHFQTSTKIEALKEEIRCMVEMDVSAKGIVISQFTSFLDLISYSLHQSGISCVQLVSEMTAVAKEAAIKIFNEDPDCRIFLTCLKSEGATLYLPVASNVFTMEPNWLHPFIERKAYSRIHRIGQNKPLRVTKFVIENSIEEKILELQQEKESSGKPHNLSTKELKDLFK